MPRLTAVCTALILLSAAVTHGTMAQEPVCADVSLDEDPQQIGCVNNILERRWLFFNKTVDASEAAEIRRPLSNAQTRVLSPIRAADPLNDRDALRLNNSVDLEIYLTGENTRSRVVLERGGLWELRQDTVPRLVITHGQMVVEHIEGRLEAYLENVLNVIHATTVYYDVDSTAGESLVFLKEGHMSFPEFGIDVQGSDSLWVLRDGEAPRAVAATAAMKRLWNSRENQASRIMWQEAQRPIVQRPKFWLLAGGMAVGATLLDCAITHVVCGGDDYTQGDYQISIPE